MGKLHELLAVDTDLRQEKLKIAAEGHKAFKDKPHLFLGSLRKLEMFDEHRKKEEAEEEGSVANTTVWEKLGYIQGFFRRFWDARLQKEQTNQIARADLVVEGKTLAKNLPVTFLLGMEEELRELRKIYEVIPTLQPGIDWKPDKDLGHGFFKSPPVSSMKTEKTTIYETPVLATPEHPAQVFERHQDKVVGRYETIKWSGMITPTEKANLLGRIDTLLKAMKKARMRGNDAEVIKSKIARKLFDFIGSGKVVE